MTRTNGVTIRDVARRAGVSVTAVSYALNGKGQLSAATRDRVRAVAAELDYQADAFARGLRQSRIGAIGLVMRSLDSMGDYAPRGVEIFARFAGALSGQALSRGLSVALLPDLSRRPSPSLAFALDGYVVVSPQRDDPVTAVLAARDIPYVTYGREPGSDSPFWGGEDDRRCARELLAHLASAGARSIALLRGTDRDSWNEDYTDEYQLWCLRRGVTPRIYEQPERAGVLGGVAAADQVHADGLPDAVICLTGRHAAGMQQRLRERGVSMPRDLLIVAGSDSEHARVARPAITAFQLSPEDCAAAVLDLLAERLDGSEPTGPRRIAARLMRRASTRR